MAVSERLGDGGIDLRGTGVEPHHLVQRKAQPLGRRTRRGGARGRARGEGGDVWLGGDARRGAQEMMWRMAAEIGNLGQLGGQAGQGR